MGKFKVNESSYINENEWLVGFEVKKIQGYPQKNETSETTVVN